MLLRQLEHEVIFGRSEARRSKTTKTYINWYVEEFCKEQQSYGRKERVWCSLKTKQCNKNHAHMIQAR